MELNCSSAAEARCDRGAAGAACAVEAVTALNTTCRCGAALALETADYASAVDVMTSYYAKAFAAGTTKQVLTQNLRLIYTYASMFAIVVGIWVWGIFADARDRDARAAAREAHLEARRTHTEAERLLGLPPGGFVSRFDVHLRLVERSLPRFATDMVRSPYAYTARLLWKKHSWLSVISSYDPQLSRGKRSVIWAFNALAIMVTQAVMWWWAFPTGVCDEVEDRDECRQMPSYFGDNGKLCIFIDPPEEVAKGQQRCQIRPPSAASITLRRIQLVVLARAGKGCEIPNFKGSYLGRFPLILVDFWTSDHLSERYRP